MAKSKVTLSDCKNSQEGWILTPWTDQQWTYLFRHSNKRVRAYISTQATGAAKNDNIGYDVLNRTSFWDNLMIFGFRASNIKVKCGADHASSVAAIVRGAGTILNDAKILSNVLPNMTARNAKDMLTKAGFSCTNDQGYLLSDGYLQAGDILWKQGHMCIVVANGQELLSDKGTNGLSQFLDTVKSHLGEDNAWTRAMMGKDVLLPNQAWDAAYISACAKQNGLIGSAFVESTNSGKLIEGSVKSGYGKFVKGPADGDDEATPKVGDVIAFTYKEGQKYSHVGVVVNVHKDDVTVISGDVEKTVDSSVVRKSFKSIRGYYRPFWSDLGIDGGDYDPGDWIGESLADLYYDTSLALIREVGYMEDDGTKKLDGGKYRLSVVNYTQLAASGGFGEGLSFPGLSDEELAKFTELHGAGGIQREIGELALSLVGKPYAYGSKGPTAFDCSGLVSYIYNSVGISVGSSTDGMLSVGKANGTCVMNKNNYNISNLTIGDMIVTTSASSPSGRHVVIYVGNGKVVSASGKEVGVVARDVTTNANSIIGVVRPLLKDYGTAIGKVATGSMHGQVEGWQ